MQTALAQAEPNAEFHAPAAILDRMLDNHIDVLNHPDILFEPLYDMGYVWASIFVVLGGICVFNGHRWHKTVILVLAAIGGLSAGQVMGERLGVGPVVPSILLAAILAVIAWPAMRFTVALLAGLSGAFCGANLWTAFNQNTEQHYIGALIGLLVLGMLAFITFKAVIIAFTAILGSAMLTMGAVAAILRLPDVGQGLERSLESAPTLLPMITGAVAVIGITFQQCGGLVGLAAAAEKPSKAASKEKAPAA